MSISEEPPAAICLLGGFSVGRGGQILREDDWPRKKAASLLKRLAFERRLLKDQAIELLWPEADPASAANNLYKTLHILRRTLDAALGRGAAEAIFRYEDGVLSLMPPVWVDVLEFERLCADASTAPGEQRASGLERALDLYRGDLLPDDLYVEWTILPRRSLYRRQREARLTLAGLRREAGNFAGAIALLTPLLEQDRADEPAHRELMRLYALTGQRHEALRQYQLCVEALAAEIDVPPAAETEALYAQILQGGAALPAAPEPVHREPLHPAPPPPPMDKPHPVFVGRARELDVLQSHLEPALAGSGRVIFILGEAGQGKTSLMAEFAHRAQDDHPELVAAAGACQSLSGAADPYLPFRDLVAMLSGDWGRPWLGGDNSTNHVRRLQETAPLTAQAVAAYAPDLVDVIAPAAGSQRRDPGRRGLNQRQVFEQLRRLISALARHHPLLLLLDDLQWADSASANLLFYLGRQLANSPVLILGAYRPSEVNRSPGSMHPLAPVVQELVRYRGDILLDLGASRPAERRSFVDALLDSEPNRLDAAFREALFRRTNGQPLFTVELLRALQEQGDLVQDRAGRWAAEPNLDWSVLPTRVEAVIARRIDLVPAELRQLLSAASVEGESFTVEVAAQVQGMAVRPLLHRLSQELDRRYRLVREQGTLRMGDRPVTRYQFRHNLFQQYLYHRLSPAERRALHAEVAAALERIAGSDVDDLSASLAHHYLAAGDAARAVPFLCRAGDEARRRLALKEAIQFYRSALNHWQEGGSAARAELLHKLGETLLATGRPLEASDSFSEAGKLYEQAGRRDGVGAALRLVGRSFWEQGDRARAMDHYQRALAVLEQGAETEERARAIGAIAQMHMLADEYDQAIAWGERALRLARKLHAEDVIIHASVSIGASLVAKGEAERGLAMLAESQERAEMLGLPHDACRAYAGLGDCLVGLERYGEARALYERLLVYARKIQAGMFEGVALVQLGYLDWWTGHWGAAWDRRQAILEWMETSEESPISKIWAVNFLGLVYNDLGQPDRARAVLAGYSTAARRAAEPQTTAPHLGLLARAAQSEAEKAGLVQEILALIDKTAYPRYEALPPLNLACAWLAKVTDGDLSSVDRLEKAHRLMQNRQSGASLHEARAYAAELRGEWAQAAAGYEAAAASWEALQRPYDHLRALAGLHQALTHAEADDAHAFDLHKLSAVREQASARIEQLSAELTEPGLRQAFLASPLAAEFRKSRGQGRRG